ncbi:MAG: carboxypeptidase-like regulatory domain-containing protein [Vicingaceae bacterium]
MENLRKSIGQLMLLLLLVIISSTAFSQNSNDEKTVFSGIVFNSDALTTPLPQVNILINKTRGTNSDNKGAFSIYVKPNDTLTFSHIGYRPTTIFIPDTVKGGKLVARIFLVSDTVNIDQVVVTSLNDFKNFKDEFLNMKNDKELTTAKNNINLSVHQAKTTTGWTVEDNLERGLQREANKSIYYGQLPPENTVNFISVAAGLIDLISKDKEKAKKAEHFREFVNLQNQNNIVYLE